MRAEGSSGFDLAQTSTPAPSVGSGGQSHSDGDSWMNRIAVVVLVLLLASVARSHAQVQNVSLEKDLERYNTLQVEEIVWGNESADERRVATMIPPYFTANPDKVEVSEFVRYTNHAWLRSEPTTQAWRASLPSIVSLSRLPKGSYGNAKHRYRNHWLVHQRVYFAGVVLGHETEIHRVLTTMKRDGSVARLGSEHGVPEVARLLGIDPAAFNRWYHHPKVVALARMAGAADRDRAWALWNQDPGIGEARSLHPSFLINGKYVVDASAFNDLADVYRVSNRLIRRELEAGRSHDGPTNDAEFAEWMAPRSGEIIKREWLGRKPTWFGVYNHARREIWSLGKEGEVARLGRLVVEGNDSFFEHTDRDGKLARGHPWKYARQYFSFKKDQKPQRYGAFLLTDYLSAPDTHWVSLRFKERDAAMAFSADGKVEARNDKGSMFGSWWLEAGNLTVSFGELGAQSWPWRKVAKRVGFDVPQRSLTPWRYEEGSDSTVDAKQSASTKRWAPGGGDDNRGP